jgi:hypothetical protein
MDRGYRCSWRWQACRIVKMLWSASRRLPLVVALLGLVVLAPAKLPDEEGPPPGMRQIAGRHLTLVTDLPPDPEIDILPVVFDSAIETWCEYFRVPLDKVRSWKVRGYLIQDHDRFVAAGLIPKNLPRFLHGFQRGDSLWFYEQPSAYYRRHLLLHEGTHGFMNQFLGGCGPPWYMEGVAEYLATHRWDQGQLELAIMPSHRDEVPHWGRIRIIREELEAGRGLSLVEVMRFGPTAHLQVEPYAWCWAAAHLLDRHPEFQAAFREAQGNVRDDSLEFSRALSRRLGSSWSNIELTWQDFVRNLDYGYDVPRAVLRFTDPAPIGGGGAEVMIRADRGWQSSGLRMESGSRYVITARGRFQVHDEPRPWISEPAGVTLRYIDGQPLGALLAAIVPLEDVPSAAVELQKPILIGAQRTVEAPRSGTLFFKVNDSPAELAGNRGEITVRIDPHP